MTKLYSALLYANTAATAEGEPASVGATLISLLPFALVLVVFYFVLIRPQRKKDKADEEMRNNLSVGDVVTTRGGIIGKVSKIKDDQLTIEPGKDGPTMTIARWAVAMKEEKISD